MFEYLEPLREVVQKRVALLRGGVKAKLLTKLGPHVRLEPRGNLMQRHLEILQKYIPIISQFLCLSGRVSPYLLLSKLSASTEHRS